MDFIDWVREILKPFTIRARVAGWYCKAGPAVYLGIPPQVQCNHPRLNFWNWLAMLPLFFWDNLQNFLHREANRLGVRLPNGYTQTWESSDYDVDEPETRLVNFEPPILEIVDTLKGDYVWEIRPPTPTKLPSVP